MSFFLSLYYDSPQPKNGDTAEKPLPLFHCNRSGFKSKKPTYLHGDLFVYSNSIKYPEID